MKGGVHTINIFSLPLLQLSGSLLVYWPRVTMLKQQVMNIHEMLMNIHEVHSPRLAEVTEVLVWKVVRADCDTLYVLPDTAWGERGGQ